MTQRGQIISFYSYKGGVGRTMALANIGTLLGQAVWKQGGNKKVLLIDWDLEAPGLYPYFQDRVAAQEVCASAGVLDYFLEVQDRVRLNKNAYRDVLELHSRLNEIVTLDDFIIRDAWLGLDLMPPGRMSSDYRSKVSQFDWAGLWLDCPAVFDAFREELSSRYAYVLIDSRTGYSDTSSICGAVMPEKVVMLLVLNRQNLDGSIEVAKRCVHFRARSNDIRPLVMFPLISRVENTSSTEEEGWFLKVEEEFENCFGTMYRLSECDLSEYFLEYFVPHVVHFSAGEKLANPMGEFVRRGSLTRVYRDFARFLISHDAPWQKDAPPTDIEIADIA